MLYASHRYDVYRDGFKLRCMALRPTEHQIYILYCAANRIILNIDLTKYARFVDPYFYAVGNIDVPRRFCNILNPVPDTIYKQEEMWIHVFCIHCKWNNIIRSIAQSFSAYKHIYYGKFVSIARWPWIGKAINNIIRWLQISDPHFRLDSTYLHVCLSG